MRTYEVMVILDPSLEERTVEPSLDKYLNVVRKDGGTVESVDVWGRRRLAYEINKKAEGIYAVVSLSAEPATVKELDRQLGLNESVLRTKVPAPRRLSVVAHADLWMAAYRLSAAPRHDEADEHSRSIDSRRPDMAGETVITVVGNLVDDPELRFTPSGAAVANFRIASTPRTLDKQTNEWKDGDALFLSCSVWRQAAENVAESLQKGMRVVVQGRLKQRQYETREGEKRTVVELDVDEVGPSLKYATAKVTRTTRQGGGGGYSGGGGCGGGDDPWASAAPRPARCRPGRPAGRPAPVARAVRRRPVGRPGGSPLRPTTRRAAPGRQLVRRAPVLIHLTTTQHPSIQPSIPA